MVINFSVDDLLKKAKMDNKYEFILLIIKRIRQLIKEKEKMGILGLGDKLTTIALTEIREGKLKKT